MEGRNAFVTITVFMLCGNIKGLNMNDVCSTNDNTCKTPSISGVEIQKWGKCSKTGVLLRFQEKTLLECGQECLLTAECTSINYRSNKNLCDIVSSTSGGNYIDSDSTCFNSDISNWHKSLAGECADHTCAAGTKCKFDKQNGIIDCVNAYCTDLPLTPNAEIVERFGLYRNFNMANKYKCRNGYLMIGRHFAICRATGDWDVLFSCIEGEEFNGHRYFFQNEVIKWDDAKNHCAGLSASLVAVGSEEENSWIREHASIHYGSPYGECADHTCAAGTKCKFDKQNGIIDCVNAYKFQKNEVIKWDDAKNHCAGLSASLVAVGSEEENSWIREHASIHYENVTEIWTGFKFILFEGYRWHFNGNTVTPSYTNWEIGQPGVLGACVQMNLNDGRWHNKYCVISTHFVCEQGNTV
ncbi:unnamed protein product [Mytilus coruscus]|uniref:MRC n=1 Tax=Mytilus coruscus TaxID=42192 RepID=A0A6J8DZ72_MYTCO|nr:unnamed protein product [Mytilus coruscus]